MSTPQAFAEIERGTDEVLPRDEFRNRLIEAEKTGRRLIVKAGFDPTARDLHLGHTLLLNRLRERTTAAAMTAVQRAGSAAIAVAGGVYLWLALHR